MKVRQTSEWTRLRTGGGGGQNWKLATSRVTRPSLRDKKVKLIFKTDAEST